MTNTPKIKLAVRRLLNRKATAKTLRRLSYWRGVKRKTNDRKIRAIIRSWK